jgi:hypothetical protein
MSYLYLNEMLKQWPGEDAILLDQKWISRAFRRGCAQFGFCAVDPDSRLTLSETCKSLGSANGEKTGLKVCWIQFEIEKEWEETGSWEEVQSFRILGWKSKTCKIHQRKWASRIKSVDICSSFLDGFASRDWKLRRSDFWSKFRDETWVSWWCVGSSMSWRRRGRSSDVLISAEIG